MRFTPAEITPDASGTLTLISLEKGISRGFQEDYSSAIRLIATRDTSFNASNVGASLAVFMAPTKNDRWRLHLSDEFPWMLEPVEQTTETATFRWIAKKRPPRQTNEGLLIVYAGPLARWRSIGDFLRPGIDTLVLSWSGIDRGLPCDGPLAHVTPDGLVASLSLDPGPARLQIPLSYTPTLATRDSDTTTTWDKTIESLGISDARIMHRWLTSRVRQDIGDSKHHIVMIDSFNTPDAVGLALYRQAFPDARVTAFAASPPSDWSPPWRRLCQHLGFFTPAKLPAPPAINPWRTSAITPFLVTSPGHDLPPPLRAVALEVNARGEMIPPKILVFPF